MIAVAIAYGYGGDPADALHRTEANLQTITRPGSVETLAYNNGSNSTPDTGEVRSVAFQNNGTLETAYTFGRDILGRLSSVERTAGGTQTVGYNYNADGRLWSESQPWASPGTLSAVYGYYGSGAIGGPAGTLQSVRLSNGLTDLTSQTYTYNAKTQRLETVASAGMTHTYEYRLDTDLVASLSSSNNITASYQYEPNTGRLQSISWYCGTTTVYSISYTYNANDQRSTATETRLLADDSTDTHVYTFAYDAYDHLSRVTIVDESENPPSQTQYTYTYDALGNRTGTGYSVNDLNQYILIPGNEDVLTYDSRGNQTYDGTRVMTYDAQDRLRSVVKGSIKEEYDYDYQGRRTVKRTYDAGGPGGWTLRETRTFAYAGENLIAEFITDATHTTPTLARAYTWGVSLGGGVGGLLSVRDYLAAGGAQTYKPFFNGNGDVMGLTDASGAVVARYEYDPYGNELSATGPAAGACPFRFATMYYDAETGLYYDKMRYYSPELQRWLTRDPAEESGGANLYVYCEGDPVNKVDPTGMATIDPEQTRETIGVRRLPREGILVVRPEGTFLDWCGPLRTTGRNTPDGWYLPNPAAGPAGWLFARDQAVYEVHNETRFADTQYGNECLLIIPPASGAKRIDAWALADAIVDQYHEAAATLQHICDTGQAMGDMAADVVPGLGWVKAGYEGITGKSFTKSNTAVSSPQRIIGLTIAAVAALKAVQWMADVAREVKTGLNVGRDAAAARSQSAISVGASGHHVPAVRKSQGRLFEVGRGDKTRPTMHSIGSNPAHDHWLMHDAERQFVGPRQGSFNGSDSELFEAYRKAYSDLKDIRVDVRSPNGTHVLGRNVTPSEAVDLIEQWLKDQGLR